LFSLTEEKIAELQAKLDDKQTELVKVESTSEKDQWKMELNEFLEIYKEWSEAKPEILKTVTNTKTKKIVKSSKKILNII
jgi:hypothetical protein